MERSVFFLLLFLVGLLLPVIYGFFWMRKSTVRSLRGAAKLLGLKPGSTETSTQGVPHFEGELNGVRIRLGGWDKTSDFSLAAAIESPAAPVVRADLPSPLPSTMQIRPAFLVHRREFQSGDSAFDRDCGVVTEDSGETARLLDSPIIREQIREFILGSPSSVVTHSTVFTDVFSAAQLGPARVAEIVRNAAYLAAAISDAHQRPAVFSGDLPSAGYAIADEYRSGRWPHLADDHGGQKWRKTWDCLIKELAHRSPGFTSAQYREALEKGFRDSR